jgi:23S rRNA-/tRNA-specific pseudouridylate synthase
VLHYRRPGWAENPAPAYLDILWWDAHLVAVHKPSGWVQAAAGGGSLVGGVQRLHGLCGCTQQVHQVPPVTRHPLEESAVRCRPTHEPR